MRPHAPPFELDREIGAGSLGRVWHGLLTRALGELRPGHEVAVKYLHPELEDDPQAAASFDKEALAGRRISHANVVQVLSQGRDERGRYLLMPFVQGTSLRAELRELGRLPEPRVRPLGAQLADALAAVHAAGYAHGDVKPDNILLDSSGRAVLMDLGFVHGPEDAASTVRRGTLAYLAPEQALGDLGGPESDLFALGLTLYEACTGSHPFLSAEELENKSQEGRALLLRALIAAAYEPPSGLVPELTPFLDHLLSELLARGSGQRPSASVAQRILQHGESDAWWRARIEYRSSARRDTVVWAGRHLIPLVGRRRELLQLEASLKATLDSSKGGRALWLEGPTGSGKSRLVVEFVHRARQSATPPLYLYGRCSEWDEERPGQPLRSLLRRWLRLPQATAPRERDRERIAAIVPPAMADTLCRTLDPEDQGGTQVALDVALATWLVRLGRHTPLIVFLDDVRWAGVLTLGALTRLSDELAQTQLLLILGDGEAIEAHHPRTLNHLRQRLVRAGTTDRIRLHPLDESAVRELVDQLFVANTPKQRLTRTLWEGSGGLPGLLAEILRSLLARGLAKRSGREDSQLSLLRDPDELTLPASMAAAIAENYAELSPAERPWLQRLSVLGPRFDREFLQLAFERLPDGELDNMLTRFVRSGWLVPVGTRYRFARPAQRQAVYREVPGALRTELHSAVANALRKLLKESGSLTKAFRHAYHLRAAQRHGDLIEVVPALIRSMLGRHHASRVLSLATWGLEALDALPHATERARRQLELLEWAVSSADRCGRKQTERELLDRLVNTSAQLQSEPGLAGRVYLLHGRHAASTGQYGLARGMLHNARQLLAQAGDGVLLADTLRQLAHIQSYAGELASARELANASLNATSAPLQRSLGHLALATVDVLEGLPEKGLAGCGRALRVLRTQHGAGPRGAFAAAYLVRARIYRVLGESARALATVQRAVRLAAQVGERRLEAEGLARLGQMLVDVGSEDEAEARLREALQLAREIEDRRMEALALVFLGTLLAEEGESEAAGRLLRAGELAREVGLVRVDAVCLALQTRSALIVGDNERGLQLADRATDILERHGAELMDHLLIGASRSLALSSVGRAREAREIRRRLSRAVREQSEQIVAPHLRRSHQRYAERLLAAALSLEGPIYPRAE